MVINKLEENMTCGIYLLYFKEIPQVYVGQSLNIERRYSQHLNELKNGTHNKKLQAAFSKYGNPYLEIAEACDKDLLDIKENHHIALWNSVVDGFNAKPHAEDVLAVYGESNGNSLYTDKKIIDLIEFITNNPTLSLKKVSDTLGINYRTVGNVANGHSYSWLKEFIPTSYQVLENLRGTRQSKLPSIKKHSKESIIAVFNAIIDNPEKTYEEIGSELDCHKSVVASLAVGNNYRWLSLEYPEKYKIMQDIVSTKKSFAGSAKAKGINYPPIISPIDGSEHTITNVSKFAKDNGLDPGSLNKLLNGKLNSTKGWVRK